jgi:hypothetical protein
MRNISGELGVGKFQVPDMLRELVVIAGEHAKNTKIGSFKKCKKIFFLVQICSLKHVGKTKIFFF